MKTNKYSDSKDMLNRVLEEDIQLFAKGFELSDQLRGKTFLVTGATGLIGSVMVKCLMELNRLKKLDIRIVIVVRSKEKAQALFGKDFSDLICLEMPLTDIARARMACHIDYIVHLACPTASKYFVEHPVETLKVSTEGTMAVLEYAKAVNAQGVVYASSLEVYGSNHTDELIQEDFQGYVNPLEVRSSYNIGKRTAECLCHAYAEEYNMPFYIARMTQTFGAGIEYEDNRVFAQFARKVIEHADIELHTSGKTSRMYCYTTDAISAMLYVLLKGESGMAYNIANKDTYISIVDMARLLRDSCSEDIKVVTVPQINHGYAPETKLRLDTSKIEQLGWIPRYDLKEMFERLIAYMTIIKDERDRLIKTS